MYLQKTGSEKQIHRIVHRNDNQEEYFLVPIVKNNQVSYIENIEGYNTDNPQDKEKFKKRYSSNIANLGKYLLLTVS